MSLSVYVQAELKLALHKGDLVLVGFIFKGRDEEGDSLLRDLSKGEVKGFSLNTITTVRPVGERNVKRTVEVAVKKGKGRRGKDQRVEDAVEYIIVNQFSEDFDISKVPLEQEYMSKKS